MAVASQAYTADGTGKEFPNPFYSAPSQVKVNGTPVSFTIGNAEGENKVVLAAAPAAGVTVLIIASDSDQIAQDAAVKAGFMDTDEAGVFQADVEALVIRVENAASSVGGTVTQTGLDRVATGQDRVQTGLDRTQTGLNATASGNSATAAAASAASAALVTGAVPRVNNAALKALDATQITKAYLTDTNREGWFHFLSGDYSAKVTADTLEYDYIKATAIAATSGAWVRKRSGNPLDHVSVTRVPPGRITLPATFNNPLGAKIYWDGTAIQYDVSPYDLLDFTKNPDTTINHYYVDYVNGNDSNAGTSAGSGNAWKTLNKANTSAVSPAVIHLMDEWVGYQNRTSAVYTWNGKFKFVSGHSSGATRFQGTRESYTKATFAWADEGGGCWSTSTATTTSTIFGSLGVAMFDAKYKDADGVAMAIPDVGSSAACIATPGSQYHDATNSKKWVHLIDGRQPDPYDGWIYCQAATSWQDTQSSDTGVLLYENIHAYANLGNSSTAIFRYRHATTATNNSMTGKKNCIAAGGSGNNFETYDAKVVVMVGCVSKYSFLDGLNYHSFQSTGTKGEYMTVYEHNCKGRYAGYTGFLNTSAINTSANASTAHDSMQILSTNAVGSDCNGAVFAYVNGVHALLYNAQASHPTGTASPKACFWHDCYLAAGNVSARYMLLFGCSAFDDGDTAVSLLDNTAQGGGAVGEIRVQYWRGQTSGKVVGALKDQAGANL